MDRLTRDIANIKEYPFKRAHSLCRYKQEDCNDSCMYIACKWLDKATDSLAEYENTDLTPQEIEQLKVELNRYQEIYPDLMSAVCCKDFYDRNIDLFATKQAEKIRLTKENEQLKQENAEYQALAKQYGIDAKTMLELAKKAIRITAYNSELEQEKAELRELLGLTNGEIKRECSNCNKYVEGQKCYHREMCDVYSGHYTNLFKWKYQDRQDKAVENEVEK